jgi:succinate dehydrogenase/fumarate reductase flavoprotein subunit
MAGEAYALALCAGAELIDMEFVQFFPIGHLAPRLVGMDPIMWDPFRYKLGGKLLNGRFEEFVNRYGGEDSGRYTAMRDLASYAILKEVEAGRGSPHNGAYLDFRHISEHDLRTAFGPVIDRLLKNGIDLNKMPVEVGPMAHYHMGGIRVDANMETRVKGLFAAGEAVGGSNGANRLSGNAITEAFVFGERAGSSAAHTARQEVALWKPTAVDADTDAIRKLVSQRSNNGVSPATYQTELQHIMWEMAGPFRTEDKLSAALKHIQGMRDELPNLCAGSEACFNLDVQDWFELRAMLVTAEMVVTAALARTESRGAHQREDFPDSNAALEQNQVLSLTNGELRAQWIDPVRLASREAAHV